MPSSQTLPVETARLEKNEVRLTKLSRTSNVKHAASHIQLVSHQVGIRLTAADDFDGRAVYE